jgi:hypothetical protein
MRKRRPYTDARVRNAIAELARSGFAPVEIDRRLKDRDDLPRPLPVLRTIQRIFREVSPPDRSGDWSLMDAAPDEVEIMLPVLAAILERSEGAKDTMSRAEAEALLRVRTAGPDLPPWESYMLACEYLVRADAGDPTVDLDAFLAFAPWRSGENLARFRRWADRISPAMSYGPRSSATAEQRYVAALKATAEWLLLRRIEEEGTE